MKAIFTAALERPAGPERSAFLDTACGDDAEVRRRVEELLAAREQASDVLGPSDRSESEARAEVPTLAGEATEMSRPADPADLETKAQAGADAGPTPRPEPEATIDHTPTPTGSDATIDHTPTPTPLDPEATADSQPPETGATLDLDPGRTPADSGTTVGFAGNAPRDGNGHGPTRGDTVRYFGDYEIQAELGRGGMGVVYQARQVSLNRPVALKMVKAGLLAGDDELRRFKNEAEAVAMLDHPGIVPVYEVGEHEGQQYFSMKLVEGGSLVPLLERYTADPKAAARLVSEIAEAVAHAHMRGILHRDLKPANILVDDEGHPHVTDFGLAKKVEADVEFTQSGAILGTPAYMSPEQAAGRRGSITTATDVYGLGAVLYVLLTGTAPFGGDSVIETLDAVRTRPPEPPSRINSRVPRDLETIALKCLEKDPRRRYPTAQALAEDLRAWLDSRPIAARRVGAAERAWLWCRRKPAIAALAASVLVAVVGGAATTITVQARANRNLEVKNVELAEALDREEAANVALTAANARVEHRYELAMDAIRTFHTGVSEDFLLQETQFRDLRDRLLNAASDFYEQLGRLLDRETDMASRRALWQANFEVANLASQVGRKEDALAMHRRVLAGREALAAEPGAGSAMAVDRAWSILAVGRLLGEMGRTDEEWEAYERARATLVASGGSPPGARDAADPAGDENRRSVLASCDQNMGTLLRLRGRSAEALAAYGSARAIFEELVEANAEDAEFRRSLAWAYAQCGSIQSDLGEMVEALAAFEAARAICRGLAEAHPAVTEYRFSLAHFHYDVALCLERMGETAEALAAAEAGRAICQGLAEAHPAVTRFHAELAEFHNRIGNLLRQQGRASEALAAFEAARAIRQKLADDNSAVSAFQAGLAHSVANIGALLSRIGRPAEALEAYEAAVTIHQQLVEANPQVTDYQADLATSFTDMGALLSRIGRPAEALEAYEEALAIRQQLVEVSPQVTRYQVGLAITYNILGPLLKDTGRLAEALAAHEAALAILQPLAEANPHLTEVQYQRANSHVFIGLLLVRLGRPAEALEAYESSRAIYSRLAAANPQVIYYQSALAVSHNNIGNQLRDMGRLTEALESFEAALSIQRALVEGSPQDGEYLARYGRFQSNAGSLLHAMGQPVEALEALEAARAIKETLVRDHPDVPDYQSRLARSHRLIGDLLRQQGRASEALESYEAARTILQPLAEANPAFPDYQNALAWSHHYIGELLATTGRPAEALAAHEAALEIRRKLAEDDPTLPEYQRDLASSTSRIGIDQHRSGRAAEAAASFRRAITIMEQLPDVSPGWLYDLACFRALLADLAGEPGSGLDQAEGRAEADRALADLRRAVAAGYRNVTRMRIDTDLDPLRDRDDFRLLLLDLDFPAEPFAR